jgi:hypothetical protein
MIRTYAELRSLSSFEDRYNYLKLNGSVGVETFGFDRYLNQMFYRDRSWNDIRFKVIYRDSSCDLGISGREIHKGLFIHHMNPITPSDIVEGNIDALLNPDYLITTSQMTHNAIHYGSNNVPHVITNRMANDTKLW